jgi:hypothetical protein
MPPRGLELAMISALALLGALAAWKLDYLVFSALFFAAAGFTVFEGARSD